MLVDTTARFQPAPVLNRLGSAPMIESHSGTKMRVVIPGEATSGHFAIWEHRCEPGFGPPRHLHHREDEIFQVLAGKLLVWCDGETYEAGPGAIAALPRGIPHTFRVISSDPAHMLMTVVPGGFERFFAAVAELSLPADTGQMATVAENFGLELVGPPLGAENLPVA